MRIAVLRERADGERRVALVPDTVEKLVADGHEVLVEPGAGGDFYPDEAYAAAGARVGDEDALDGENALLKVQAPTEDEVDRLPEGALLVCFLDPTRQQGVLERLAERRLTVFSMTAIPRTGAAQSMDAISSMSSVAGYQAVLMAAEAAGRYLPMMTTAAGTTKAGKVMVLGVGVAGLQAIATARRLGAEVEAFDIRPEVADQVRSLGATFIQADDGQGSANEESGDDGPAVGRAETFIKALLGLPPEFGRRRERKRSDGDGRGGEDEEPTEDQRAEASEHDQDEQSTEKQSNDASERDQDEQPTEEQGDDGSERDAEKQRRDQELMEARLEEMDVVLTAALVPGQEAPKLVSAEMVERMKPGAVLFDLAVELGGNCELSEPDEVVTHDHVRIYGPVNLPSTMPIHASHLLSRNMAAVLSHLVDEDGELHYDFDDEITDGAVLAHAGEVRTS